MRKFLGLLVSICLFATMPAAAQFDFGVKGGLTLPEKPTTNFEEFKSCIKGNNGWFVGPTARFIIPIVGLGVEANVLYSQKNVEIEGNNVKTHNLDIPLYLCYELSLPVVSRFVKPFIAVGPQFSWYINDKNASSQSFRELVNSSGNPTADQILNYIPKVDEPFKQYKLTDRNFSMNLGFGVTLFKYLQIHANYNLTFDNSDEIIDSFPQNMDSFSEVLGIAKNIFETKTNTWQISLAVIF